MANVEEFYEYDAAGRMMYHPEFHFSHRIPWTESELEYLCKYYEIDGRDTISMALGKTVSSVADKMTYLKKRGLVEHYKRLNKHW
ncbi:DNA-entry nuclease [Sporosarcina sp. FSL K6-1522]|uniref:DNA-entry nuclease n=1 Tax=Sporosarcina sp. FSL K6-1522 TaxID=2921554 RepID=UPI00315A4FCF